MRITPPGQEAENDRNGCLRAAGRRLCCGVELRLAEAVASFYADAGEIVINGDGRWVGRDRVREMVAGFFANVPDMVLRCDGSRHAGAQAVFLWTFTGHDATSGKPLTVQDGRSGALTAI